MDDDEIMRQINAGGGGGMDVEDELEALEAEIAGESKKGKKKKKDGDDLSLSDLSDEEEEKKPSQKQKHDSDDDLAALEKEGLDEDLDEEEEEEKPKQKSQAKNQPKPQPKPQTQQKPPQPQIDKKELSKEIQAKKENIINSGVDLYPEKVEKKYHSVEKMVSLGVLEKEKEISDKIIENKKNRNEDYDTWEIKKESIDDKIGIVTSTIQDGIWDFEMYKKKIKEQYTWESKLLFFLEKDPSLNEQQKNILKERINNRKKIIEDELKRNPEEEAEAEEQGSSPKEEEKKPTQKEKSLSATIPIQAVGGENMDLYPEKVENKYHVVGKMVSLGVLEKEKEICNKIIEYKKNRNEDYDTWEIKKESIDDKIGIVTSTIQDGIWDFEMYKKKIKEQYAWESKLLIFLEKDPSLKEQQKNILKERVNNRKTIIEEELKRNPEEEAEAEEEEEKQPEPLPKNVEPKMKNEILKKSLNPLIDIPKEKEAEEIKRLTEEVTLRLNEYRAAIDYFKANELTEQQANAIKSTKDICVELKKIQDGKWREVNEFKLPDPVTPSYIYGCSNEERDKNFDLIISEYDKQRKKVQDEIDQKNNEFKNSKKPEQKKKEPLFKKELDELNKKKTKYEKVVQLLKANKQNKWVPAPIYIQTEEEKTVQVINEDIPENTVRIIFGKTNYIKKDKLYLKVKIEDKDIEEKISQKSPGDWSTPIDITLDQSIFKSFYTNEIKAEIFVKKHIIKDKYKGKFIMKAKGLKDQVEFSDEFPIELKKKKIKFKKDDKKEDYTVSCTFKVRTPCKTPAFEIQRYPIYQITRIYPPFNIRGGNNAEAGIKIEVKQHNVTSEDLKLNNTIQRPPAKAAPTSQRPQKKGPPATKAKAGGPPSKNPGPPKAIVDKSQFSDEELKDPDCINCLNTLQVLEFKINKYEEIRNKIDGRTPRELMQRIVKMKCKMQNLTNSLGDDISPQDYLTLLKTTFDHDKKLVDYFTQQKDAEKSKLVTERLPLILKETEELMKQMPK